MSHIPRRLSQVRGPGAGSLATPPAQGGGAAGGIAGIQSQSPPFLPRLSGFLPYLFNQSQNRWGALACRTQRCP